MPRPKICRHVHAEPGTNYFKPAGVRMSELEEIFLSVDEFEAVRLKDLEGMEQEEAAAKMNVSQPTFHRILVSGRRKIVSALVKGNAIRIEGGSYSLGRGRMRRGRCHGHNF